MRWLVLVFFPVLLLSGCDLNPQPEVPGSDEPGAGGSAGAAGAPGALETPSRNDGERAPPPDVDPNDYGGGLAASKAGRPDAGSVREAPDAGTDAPPAPPVVVVQ